MPENSTSTSSGLFLNTTSLEPTPSASYIVRSRIVEINLPLLFDENNQVRDLAGSTITINLFPDVTYTGVIEQVEENGDSYTWVGSLKDVEYSALTMIFTGGVFIAKIASPSGVYEVSSIGGDLYRIILIDQKNFQGGEDAIEANSANP